MARSSTSYTHGHPPAGGRPKGSRNKRDMDLIGRIARGELPDPVEYLLKATKKPDEEPLPRSEFAFKLRGPCALRAREVHSPD